MNIYLRNRIWKLVLLLVALFIAIASLLYTNNLVTKLADEEKKKVELVANATKIITTSADFNADLSFSFKVIRENNTVPVILTNEEGEVLSWRNLDSSRVVRDTDYLQDMLAQMKEYHEPIKISLANEFVQYIYFKPSILIDLLKFYPYVQLSIIGIFILIAYFAFSSSRNAEQNQVWVGMSKETAHQLGTPLSSLYGWLEILRSVDVDPSYTKEIEKDLGRLTTITNRFSKIGSQPKLEKVNLFELLDTSINYMKSRLSKKVEVLFNYNLDKQLEFPMNKELFAWVIENLSKNAVDAMEGQGKLEIDVTMGSKEQIYIDVKDTGKGIQKSQQTKVFKPGFTTKKRGWGLGLSLVKRIIEQYHFGKVFVKSSVMGVGTCFRIGLYPEEIRKKIV